MKTIVKGAARIKQSRNNFLMCFGFRKMMGGCCIDTTDKTNAASGAAFS
jgi:hypothetical protein